MARKKGDIVYRVQGTDGRGPWRPGFTDTWSEDRTDEEYASLLPWTVQFGDAVANGHTPGRHLGCACRTLTQLRRWFRPGEFATLLRYGFQCVRITGVRILAESDIQCVFERDKPLNEAIEAIELYPQSLRGVAS